MGATRSILIVAVAALFALIAALIVGKLFAHPVKPVIVAAAPVAKPMAQVLVAHRDLPIGTVLALGDLAWQAWPAEAVNPAFITDGQAPQAAPAAGTTAAVASSVTRVAASAVVKGPMDALYGAIVREPLLANEPITSVKLVRGGEGGFMAVVLRPGMRGVAVPVNASTAAGGFILPGDRVDVMQSHQQDSGGSGRIGQVAQVLLRNVRVLAIDQTTKAPRNTPSLIGAVATLEVPAAYADVLVRAKAQGEIILALRAYSDANGPPQTALADNSVGGVVRIYRDGKPTEVTVSP
ncbi:MAG TPA: Flp pilus assembly protein CpaB [Caulobacteraceae bacterium]|jgi:pilus assembly protein CpaB|nr:Flp pilus assembly protein CpaB [Caulobacteraceae bacterium]